MVPSRKITLEDGTKTLLPVLVITSRTLVSCSPGMIPTRYTEDLLLGMWELLQQLGRDSRRLIWDNETRAVARGGGL